jgi:formate-dependent nitrite reductase membrane component NrfD
MPPRASAGTGYYGLPLLKKPTWTWEVPVYFFVGGAAGAVAVIGAVARLAGRDGRLSRDARWIAAAGGAVSGALLTSDLGRPERFIYMLRVFKRQSPMSVGAWILTLFSLGSGAAVAAQAAGRASRGRVRLQPLADAGDAIAAVAGLGMCTYTGVLIGATVVPVWNRHAALLPLHFGASALASGVAVLELRGHRDPALRPLGLLAAAAETAVGGYIEASADEASAPLREGPSGWLTRLGGALAGPVPLLLRAVPGRSPRLRAAAALLTLAGTLVTRIAWIRAGAVSASDPAIPLQLDPAADRSLPRHANH